MRRAFFLAVVVTLSLVFCGCDSCSCSRHQEPKQKPKQLNITILLDLSDRINTEKNPEQWKYDIENIKVITDFFKSKIKENPHSYKGKIRVRLLPPPSDDLNMNSIISGLEFICQGEAVENKRIHDAISECYEQSLKEIYTQTIEAGKWEKGSDMFGFFKNNVYRCIEEDTIYRNILIIFTNGYLYAEYQSDLKWDNTTSIQPKSLEQKFQNLDSWGQQKNNVRIKTERNDLQNLGILVLGIKAEKPSRRNIDEDILKYLWGKWFDEMGVKADNYKIFTSVPPTELKADIESFLKEK